MWLSFLETSNGGTANLELVEEVMSIRVVPSQVTVTTQFFRLGRIHAEDALLPITDADAS